MIPILLKKAVCDIDSHTAFTADEEIESLILSSNCMIRSKEMKKRKINNRVYTHRLDNSYEGCLVTFVALSQNKGYCLVRDYPDGTHNYEVKKDHLTNKQGELFNEKDWK